MSALTLDFGGVTVPFTTSAQLVLWLLYTNPHKPIAAARILNCRRTAAIMRLHRAAETLGSISPVLAVALREHVHWSGGVARYVPAIRKM